MWPDFLLGGNQTGSLKIRPSWRRATADRNLHPLHSHSPPQKLHELLPQQGGRVAHVHHSVRDDLSVRPNLRVNRKDSGPNGITLAVINASTNPAGRRQRRHSF